MKIDLTHPYFGPAESNLDAFAGYTRRLWKNSIEWRVQLNVRNVLDQYTVYPLIDVDTRDGNHTPTTAIYTLKEPRTYLFTSAFRF